MFVLSDFINEKNSQNGEKKADHSVEKVYTQHEGGGFGKGEVHCIFIY